MSISKTQNVPDHRHNGKRTSVVSAALQPHFRVPALSPQNLVQIVAIGVFKRVSEYLHLLKKRKSRIIGAHLGHQAALDIEQDLSRLSVFLDESVESVGMRHPSNKTRVRAERNYSVSFSSHKNKINYGSVDT